jgi:Putative methyltransferase
MFKTLFMAVRGVAAAAEGAQRIEIGCTCGFDSGVMLDHVYGNEAEGGFLINRLNIDVPGKSRPATRASGNCCVNEHVPVSHIRGRAAFPLLRAGSWLLVTCWPLDSILPGPLRYVVYADLVGR